MEGGDVSHTNLPIYIEDEHNEYYVRLVRTGIMGPNSCKYWSNVSIIVPPAPYLAEIDKFIDGKDYTAAVVMLKNLIFKPACINGRQIKEASSKISTWGGQTFKIKSTKDDSVEVENGTLTLDKNYHPSLEPPTGGDKNNTAVWILKGVIKYYPVNTDKPTESKKKIKGGFVNYLVSHSKYQYYTKLAKSLILTYDNNIIMNAMAFILKYTEKDTLIKDICATLLTGLLTLDIFILFLIEPLNSIIINILPYPNNETFDPAALSQYNNSYVKLKKTMVNEIYTEFDPKSKDYLATHTISDYMQSLNEYLIRDFGDKCDVSSYDKLNIIVRDIVGKNVLTVGGKATMPVYPRSVHELLCHNFNTYIGYIEIVTLVWGLEKNKKNPEEVYKLFFDRYDTLSPSYKSCLLKVDDPTREMNELIQFWCSTARNMFISHDKSGYIYEL